MYSIGFYTEHSHTTFNPSRHLILRNVWHGGSTDNDSNKNVLAEELIVWTPADGYMDLSPSWASTYWLVATLGGTH